VKGKGWPSTILVGGQVYTRTGKTGTNVRTGLPSAEYELTRRAWLLEGGEVENESGSVISKMTSPGPAPKIGRRK